MAVPIQLEIFMKDLTQAGLLSVAKNVEGAEQETLSLIKALQKVRAEYVRILNANKEAGKSYQQEAAMVQALTGQIKGLKEGLKELQKAKQQTSETPVVSPNTTVDMDDVSRKTNNLRMQFSQVARELPSLAMGPQMFILAISNNLPMLTAAIADVRKQNELLKASGKSAVPVWKQLASSLFSWQTGLVAAISLGIVFGKDIADWTKKVFNASKSLDTLSDAQQRYNKLLLEGNKEAQNDINRLRVLYNAATDAAEGTETRRKAIDELKKQYPSYFGNLDQETIMLGKAADAYERLTANLIASSRARASMKFMDENSAKILELEQKITAEHTKREQAEANLEKRIDDRDKIDRNMDPDGYAGAQMLVGAASGKIKAIDDKIAEWRQELYLLQKANKELEAGIDINALFEDFNKTDDKGGTTGNQLKKDYATELAEARLRAEQTVERLRIQLMQEGIEKRKAMARQEYDEQKADIDRQEQETLAKMDAARKQGDTITDSQYEQVRQNANQQRILQQQVLNRKLTDIDREYQEQAIEAQIAYNKQYGTYAEQRAAIIAEGLRKAAKAETDGARDLIMRQTEDALKELDFAHFKDSINFADVFGQLDTQTTDALTILRDKLKEYINNAAGELGPEDLKELQDAFKELDLKIGERNPFGELRSGMDEYRTAQEDVKKAQADLNTVMQGGEVILSEYVDENGNAVKTLLTLEQAEANLNNAQQKRQQTLEKLTRSANSIGAQGMQVVNAGRDIVEMLGNFGVEVPEAVTATLDGLGQVMSGLESIDLTKPFSMITGSVSILAGIGNTIAGLFGGGRDFSDYEELKSRYEALSDIWDTLISKKQEYIDIDYGVEAQKAADEARQLVEVSIQRQRQLAEALARSGSGWFSHSEGYKIRTGMGEEGWKRLSDLVGQDVGSIYDVLNLAPDVIGKVLQDEQFVSVLTSVNSEFITYIENIEKYGEQLEEIARQEQEAITGIGFDAFKDGYIDMLADLSSSNEDFADNFEKQLQNAIFRSLIANKYTSQIQNLYDEWVRLGEDGLTKSEVEYLRNLQQSLTDKLVQERENMKDLFGWESEDEKQTDTAIEGLEELQKAYEKLSEASSKAFSSEAVKILKQQNENLNEQVSFIRKRIDEENRSANPDTDYLDELKGQLEDINAQIEDNKEAMKDAIFGEDIQSAISNFVSVYTEALGDGGSMQKMSKDFVESMVQNMVTESMKADASPVMENIREKLIEAWKDGVVTADEQLSIEEIVNNLNKELSDKYGWAEGLFGESDIKGLEALQDAYDKLSDSVSEAYSSEKSELLKQQSEILRQQRDLILERLEAEKALGERGDASLVNEWEEQLEEVNSKIEENKEAQLDAIFGQETQTQISNLANALINVWSGAKKQADSAKDFINNIIRSMVLESLMLDLTPFIDSLREQMAEMFEDGIISADEGDALAGMVEGVMNSLEKQYEWADRFMKDSEEIAQEVEEMKQSLTGLTLDSFTDSFVSGLADMSKSYKDMCDDFEDSLRNSIFKGLVESQYKNRITALYNMWERAAESEGQITDKEAEQLRYEYQQIIQDLMKQRDEMAQDFGWANTTDQSPSSGALTTMSQDSIAAFEGIGRNMQTHLANMDRYVQELRETQRLDSETPATIASHTAYIVLIYDLMEDMKLNGIKMQ